MHAILKALPAHLQQLQEKKDKEKEKEKDKEKEVNDKEKPNNWNRIATTLDNVHLTVACIDVCITSGLEISHFNNYLPARAFSWMHIF